MNQWIEPAAPINVGSASSGHPVTGLVNPHRIISNAGAQDHKPATSTINCTVSGTIDDSMEKRQAGLS